MDKLVFCCLGNLPCNNMMAILEHKDCVAEREYLIKIMRYVDYPEAIIPQLLNKPYQSFCLSLSMGGCGLIEIMDFSFLMHRLCYLQILFLAWR